MQHVHLVGIGGFGISAIARILLEKGYRVSGSDRKRNALMDALARDGATIYEGHDARYVEGADRVIITSALSDDHVEVKAARERGIPVQKRNEMIGELMHDKTVIAVAGTHGKTTTTAMITHILRECGQDPSYIVGGIMGNTGTNAGVGQGAAFVIEADEYDHMFLGLEPDIVVLTSVEYDHPDFFESEDAMLGAFRRFVDLLPEDGTLIAHDSTGKLLEEQQQLFHWRCAERLPARRIITYGAGDLTAENIRMEGVRTFDVVLTRPLQEALATVWLPLPGDHNIQNALAALIAANTQGVSIHDAAAALSTFKSTGRRFEERGEVNGVIVVDDYAHHPTAIRMTLEGARTRYPGHTLWAVWQPHTFTRTAALLDDYATAFDVADHVVVTDIYAARERADEDTMTGAQAAAALKHPDVKHTATLDDATAYLLNNAQAPAVIVVLSAGDAPEIGTRYLSEAQHGADAV